MLNLKLCLGGLIMLIAGIAVAQSGPGGPTTGGGTGTVVIPELNLTSPTGSQCYVSGVSSIGISGDVTNGESGTAYSGTVAITPHSTHQTFYGSSGFTTASSSPHSWFATVTISGGLQTGTYHAFAESPQLNEVSTTICVIDLP